MESPEFQLQDYERMVYKLAHRARARLAGAGIDVDVEELTQEGREAFVKAVRAFDPNRQVKFSTYLWNALGNNLNRFCDKLRDAHWGTVSLDGSRDEEGDAGNLIDVVANPNAVDAAAALEARQEAFHNLRQFDPDTRRVLVLLIAPPAVLRAEIERMQAFSDHAHAQGFAAPRVSFGVNAIMQVLGYDDARQRQVRAAIKTFMERQ